MTNSLTNSIKKIYKNYCNFYYKKLTNWCNNECDWWHFNNKWVFELLLVIRDTSICKNLYYLQYHLIFWTFHILDSGEKKITFKKKSLIIPIWGPFSSRLARHWADTNMHICPRNLKILNHSHLNYPHITTNEQWHSICFNENLIWK